MVASGVGVYSINVKSNLKEFYGELERNKKSLKDLTKSKYKLEIDSKNLDRLRKEGQQLAQQMKELRQQKTEIKVGLAPGGKAEIEAIDKNLARLNAKKISIESEIQPIRTANAELYKTQKEIDRINAEKVKIETKVDRNEVKTLLSEIKALENQKIEIETRISKESKSDIKEIDSKLESLNSQAEKVKIETKVDRNEVKTLLSEIKALENQKIEIETRISQESKSDIKEIDSKLESLNSQVEKVNKTSLKIDVKEALNSLGNVANKIGDIAIKLSATFATSFIAGGTFATKGLWDSMLAAGDLEQSIGGIEKLLSESSDMVIANAKRAYQTAGLSQNEYLQTATSYSAKLLQDLGGDQVATARVIDQAIVQMSDNVNTYGTSMSTLQQAYSGFSRGTFTMLDSLKIGYDGTQAEALRLVKDMGVVEDSVQSINDVSFSDFIKAVGLAQEKLGIAGTTAKEAATTFSGAKTQLTKALENFKATGEGADDVIDSLFNFAKIGAKLAKELAPKLIDGLKQMVAEIKPQLPVIFEELSNFISDALDAVFGEGFSDSFKDGFKFLKPIFEGLKKIIGGADGISGEDLGKLAPNLLKFGLAMKALGGTLKGLSFLSNFKLPNLSGIFGKFGSGGGGSKVISLPTFDVKSLKTLATGLGIIVGLSASLFIASKAIQELDKINLSLGLAGKLGVLVLIIGAMGLVAVAIGALVTLPGVAILAGAGLATILLLAGGLLLITEAFDGIVQNIESMSNSLDKIQGMELDSTAIIESVETILEVIDKIGVIGDGGVFGMLDSVGDLVQSFLDLGMVASIVLIASQLSQLQGLSLDTGAIQENVGAVTQAISVISTAFQSDIGGLLESAIQALDSIAKEGMVSKFVEIASQLSEISALDINQSVLEENVKAVTESLSIISTAFPTDFESIISDLAGYLDAISREGMIDKFVKIAKSLEELNGIEIEKEAIKEKIEAVKEVIESFGGNEGILESFGEWVVGGGEAGSGTFDNAKDVIEDLLEIAKKIEELGAIEINAEDIKTKIEAIKQVLQELENFPEISTTMIDSALETINSLIASLDGLVSEFETTGLMYAMALNDGFVNGDVPSSYLSVLEDTLGSLEALEGRFNALGSTYATAVNSGFSSNLDLSTALANALSGLAASAFIQGSNIGSSIASGIQSALNASNITANVSQKTTGLASGGIAYLATGGIAGMHPGSPSGTDIVPAWLTPGEGVLQRAAMNIIGPELFHKLNNLDLKGAYSSLASKIGTSVANNSVINNFNNVDNRKNNVNVNVRNQKAFEFRANRVLRGV